MDEMKTGYRYARAMHTSTTRRKEMLLSPQEEDPIMARFLHQDFCAPNCNAYRFRLAFFWIAGLMCGIAAFSFSGISSLPMMRSISGGTVSIVSLLTMISLPFLLSAFAVLFSCHRLLFLIAFLKAFTFSFVSIGIMVAYGGAGWLIRLLLCFADLVCLPVLYLFWLRILSGFSRPGYDILAVASVYLLIGSIDFCVITPFWAELINF